MVPLGDLGFVCCVVVIHSSRVNNSFPGEESRESIASFTLVQVISNGACASPGAQALSASWESEAAGSLLSPWAKCSLPRGRGLALCL